MSKKFALNLQNTGNCITNNMTEIFLSNVNAIFNENRKITIELLQVEMK